MILFTSSTYGSEEGGLKIKQFLAFCPKFDLEMKVKVTSYD
jgi:hypothetical protein